MKVQRKVSFNMRYYEGINLLICYLIHVYRQALFSIHNFLEPLPNLLTIRWKQHSSKPIFKYIQSIPMSDQKLFIDVV